MISKILEEFLVALVVKSFLVGESADCFEVDFVFQMMLKV